jgi:hypothetical protein
MIEQMTLQIKKEKNTHQRIFLDTKTTLKGCQLAVKSLCNFIAQAPVKTKANI